MRFFVNHDKSTERVTRGRFEFERNGDVAYLEYALTATVLELIHTEVPKSMRGAGVASTLAHSALEWAREHKVKVDVICPYVAAYLKKRRPRHLPMRLLVQIAQGHGVGQQLVQLLGHFQAHRFLKLQRQQMVHGPVSLDLAGALVKARLRADFL